jgi:hypothetical protein
MSRSYTPLPPCDSRGVLWDCFSFYCAPNGMYFGRSEIGIVVSNSYRGGMMYVHVSQCCTVLFRYSRCDGPNKTPVNGAVRNAEKVRKIWLHVIVCSKHTVFLKSHSFSYEHNHFQTNSQIKAKSSPLRVTETLAVRQRIAPTHSLPRH